MPMPAWLALIVVGAIVLIAAYHLPMLPPEVVAVVKFIGIVLLVFGAVLFLLVMIALAGIQLPG